MSHSCNCDSSKASGTFSRELVSHCPGFCSRIYRTHHRVACVHILHACVRSHTRTRPNPPTCICKPYRAPRMRRLCNRSLGATSSDAAAVLFIRESCRFHISKITRFDAAAHKALRSFSLSLSFLSLDLFHIYFWVSPWP